MEAFEKELNESKAKDADDDEEGDENQVPELDEAELGDDPFARGGGEGVSLDSGNEPWLDRKSTRLNSSHSGESRMPSSA